MRPYPEEVVRAIQSGVMTHFAPELTSTYAQAQLAFGMLLFAIVQRDYDTAVPDLIAASAALRDLLASADAGLALIDSEEAHTAREAIAAIPGQALSLRLSDLRAEDEALRDALGKLAPLVEPAADVPALAPLRPVRASMCEWLAVDAKRRIFPILSA
jgi:hypothetical protein